MKKARRERIEKSLPSIEDLKKRVRGNPDLELVAQRVEQIELLLEAMAQVKDAANNAEREAAEAKLAANRQGLREALPERSGVGRTGKEW